MLSPKQARFAQEYVIDLNATQAAIRAGYSDRGANVQAVRLLANVTVQAEIQKLQAKHSKKLDITAERVLQELATLAFFDAGDLYETQGEGEAAIHRLLPVKEMPAQARRAIVGIGYTQFGPKYRIADKKGALDSLARHLGMFAAEKVDVDGVIKFVHERIGGAK